MKISYNWLKQFIRLDWEAEKTSELLTDIGLEVEKITNYESVKGGLEGVVVGQVLSCEQHSNADKLKVTKVDLGLDQPVQIVCGASNVAAGQKVMVATVGTILYDGEGKEWKIKKTKIRGEESHGMICAEDELGLGSSHEGIMVLHVDIPVGTPASKVYDVEKDNVFEIGLTPNRADAMSHWGVARDLKAGLFQKDIKFELITPSVSNFQIENRTRKVTIDVLNTEMAPRYCGVTLTNIEVKESPAWLQHRLKAIGLSPINNIVDITNYVMHELGQPLHAFDADKIQGNAITVKTVKAGTKFVTLDEQERELHEEDLMICDTHKPLCIAGVYGGITSKINENTTTIFLESAYFDPISIRKTAKRHGLNTDASFKFERGVDPNITEYALKRAALLIKELASGVICSDIEDLYPKKIEDYQVFLSYKNITKLIGQEIPADKIKSILTSLELKINNVTEGGIGLTIPAYRNDVRREADVIEEILRIYGYNNIAFSQKLNASIAEIEKYSDNYIQNTISNQLVAQGFFEMMSNSLTSSKYNALLHTEGQEEAGDNTGITILNALSNDLSVMRQSMLFSALEAVSYNQNRKRFNLKLFEFGKTYHQIDKNRVEKKHLSIVVSGDIYDKNWNTNGKESNFYYLKAVVENILSRLGVKTSATSLTDHNTNLYNEGLTYYLGKSKLVTFGVVKSSILKYFSLNNHVYFADFEWDTILNLKKSTKVKFTNIPKFPEVKRDFSLLIEDHVSFEEIQKVAKQTEKTLLKEISLFDVYKGDNLPSGKKSYAVSFTLQDHNKTLTESKIEQIMSKLKTKFESELGAQLR